MALVLGSWFLVFGSWFFWLVDRSLWVVDRRLLVLGFWDRLWRLGHGRGSSDTIF